MQLNAKNQNLYEILDVNVKICGFLGVLGQPVRVGFWPDRSAVLWSK